jgi:hypothetical protein
MFDGADTEPDGWEGNNDRRSAREDDSFPQQHDASGLFPLRPALWCKRSFRETLAWWISFRSDLAAERLLLISDCSRIRAEDMGFSVNSGTVLRRILKQSRPRFGNTSTGWIGPRQNRGRAQRSRAGSRKVASRGPRIHSVGKRRSGDRDVRRRRPIRGRSVVCEIQTPSRSVAVVRRVDRLPDLDLQLHEIERCRNPKHEPG